MKNLQFLTILSILAFLNYICFSISADMNPNTIRNRSLSHQERTRSFFGTRISTESSQIHFPEKFTNTVYEVKRLSNNLHSSRYTNKINNNQWRILRPSVEVDSVADAEIDLTKFNSLSLSKPHTDVNFKNNLQSRTSGRRCISAQGSKRRKCLKKIKRKNIFTVGKMEDVKNNSNNQSTLNNVLQIIHVRNTNREPGSVTEQTFKGESIKRIDSQNGIPKNGNGNSNAYQALESKPCSCYWNLQNCGCNCRGSLNYEDFMDLSKIFRPCKNFTFSMTDGHYYSLPPNLFSNLNLVHNFNITITNATFEYLLDPTPTTSAFTGVYFSRSAVVKLKNVSVRRSWNWTPFEKLRGIEGAYADIHLEDCILRRLTSDFSNVVSGQVENIEIDNSNLEMIGSSAFQTFANMTHFRVPNNKIRYLRRVEFPKIPLKLEEMDLRNNQLQNLEDDMFADMPSLKEVSLAGNPLIMLSEKTFHDIIHRITLKGISEFPLHCDCHLKWLKDSKNTENDVIKKNMKGATCKRPGHLRGTPFDNLSKEHLICK